VGSTSDSSKGPRASVLAALVAALGMAAFAAGISGPFIYDDRALVADNVHVHSFAEWRRWLTHDFWDVSDDVKQFTERMIYWRPGVSASYAADWLLGGGSPVVFHATNLLGHAAASLLAFSLLLRWTGATMPAFFAALLFAVHPTKAESVAWIAGRTDVLCAVAMFLASWGVALRLRGRRGGIWLEALATVAAYTLKEQAVVLVAFAAVEAWAFLGRPAIDPPALGRMAKAALPQLVAAVGYVAARAVFFPIRPPEERTLGFLPHVEEVFETMGRYAALVFVPHDLSVEQGLLRAPGGKIAFDATYVGVGVAFVASLATIALLARKRAPGVAVGIGFFAITILPTSNVVTTDLMMMLSERFLYVPLLGLALSAATAGALVARRGATATNLVVAAACAAAITLGTVGARHAADFQDEDRFWARELALHPDSLEALRFQIQSHARKKQFGKAVERVARAQHLAANDYPQTGQELDFILQGVELLLAALPDHDARMLHVIDEFLASLSREGSGIAVLDARTIQIRLAVGGPTVRARVRKEFPRVTALRAGIKSRLARDGDAIELAEAAHGACMGCVDVGRTAALVLARAGRYDRGNRILDDVARAPGEVAVAATRNALRSAERASREGAAADGEAARLQLRATELCALEAWGRAFDVLEPSKAEIERAPGFALGFAELAWRAGEFKVAREVLAKVMPPEAAERATRGWSAKMGWNDDNHTETDDALPL
jgi:hypothetical protein